MQPAGQQQQAGEAAAGSAPLLGWLELRQQLLDRGANPAYATEGWVQNHFRWVVWRLARLRLLLAGSGAGGAPGSSGGAPALLTAAVVLDELQLRRAELAAASACPLRLSWSFGAFLSCLPWNSGLYSANARSVFLNQPCKQPVALHIAFL